MTDSDTARQWRAEQQARRERALQEPGTIEARSPGRCPVCGYRFPRGEPIRRTVEGWQPAVGCCGGDLED